MGSSLRAGFDVLHLSMLLKEGLNLFRRYGSLICQIALVTHQQNLRFRWARVSYLLVPVIDSIEEGLMIGYIENYQQCVSSSIV